MVAVPSVGRASGVEPQLAPGADATQLLYQRYAGQIFAFCLHKLGSREEAEDAVQTTFLNAFRGLQRGIVPHAESAWLFKIAENVCLSRHRSAWRRKRVESPSDLESLHEVVAAPQHSRGDELIGLNDALAGMPENQRRAILLREWQGLSYREIADEMELSQAAVETLIFRARRSLAQGLEEQEASGGWRKARRGLDVGSLLAGLKTALAGGAAVKVAAVAVAVTGASVAAGFPLEHHFQRPPAAPAVHARTPVAPSRADFSPRDTAPAPTASEQRVSRPAINARPPRRAGVAVHKTAPAPAPGGGAGSGGQAAPPAVAPAPPAPATAADQAPAAPPTPAPAPAAPPQPAHEDPPAKPAEHVPPGQAKKDPPPAAPAAAAPAANHRRPEHVPPGQAKKDPAAGQPQTGSASPAPPAALTQPVTVEPPAPAASPATPADHGNGNGSDDHGNGNGKHG